MYAVIETGGKQYRVVPGETVDVDTMAGEIGAEVTFDRVLAISTKGAPAEMIVGRPVAP